MRAVLGLALVLSGVVFAVAVVRGYNPAQGQ